MTAPTVTNVPAVLAALAAILTDADQTTTHILWAPQNRAADFNVVGWAGPENASVAATQQTMDYALQQNEDTYDVTVQLVAWGGTNNPLPSVQRVCDRQTAFVDGINADPTLGGVCMFAQVISWTLMPDVTNKGAQAVLTPVVQIRSTTA